MTTHTLHGLTIHTSYDPKPIPIRGYDWSAIEDSYEPGMPVGYGRTEEKALEDLLEQLEDANDDELRHAVETGEWRAP
jgi:hypothetical protein